MVKKKTKLLLNNIFLLAPAVLIFGGSHLFALFYDLTEELVMPHIMLNLFGVLLLTGHVLLEEFVI